MTFVTVCLVFTVSDANGTGKLCAAGTVSNFNLGRLLSSLPASSQNSVFFGSVHPE